MNTTTTTEPKKTAAVAYIEREDGRLLCVWNKRYNGWSLPGGMTEPGETTRVALLRELEEETGLQVARAPLGDFSPQPTARLLLIYQGAHGIPAPEGVTGRASEVCLYAVQPAGEPREMEEGCPVAWKTRQEFLAESPFASFYAQVFAAIPAGRYAETAAWPQPFVLVCQELAHARLLEQNATRYTFDGPGGRHYVLASSDRRTWGVGTPEALPTDSTSDRMGALADAAAKAGATLSAAAVMRVRGWVEGDVYEELAQLRQRVRDLEEQAEGAATAAAETLAQLADERAKVASLSQELLAHERPLEHEEVVVAQAETEPAAAPPESEAEATAETAGPAPGLVRLTDAETSDVPPPSSSSDSVPPPPPPSPSTADLNGHAEENA